MPNWKQILDEIQADGSTHDVVRRKYLAKLHEVTGRNVIAYYSGWLQKRELANKGFGGFDINDGDKTGFMSTVHGMDKSKGLDLILHTPGGEIAATESIMNYLHSLFGNDIRAIVPELAMSCGTMIALGCKEIVMGLHSSLGPIDPQFGGTPAHGIIEEFTRVAKEIQADQRRIPLWQPILAKYVPTLIGECEKAIEWSNQIVKQWLIEGMFKGEQDATTKADTIIAELADHALQKSHARHISIKKAKDLGIKVVTMEEDKPLQDAALTVHHACLQTLSSTGAYKIIENHKGVAFIQTAAPVLIRTS